MHLNRLIKAHELDMLLVAGPGHGGPGIVANTYLEGSYTEHYPAIERDRSGMRRLFRNRPAKSSCRGESGYGWFETGVYVGGAQAGRQR